MARYRPGVLTAHLPRGAGSARLLLSLALERGLDRQQVLSRTGLRESDLADPLAEIRTEQELQLIRNLVRLDDAPDLGLVAGSRYEFSLFGMFGFACLSAGTLQEMVEISLRYQDLAFTLASARMEREATMTFIALDVAHLPAEVHRFVVDHLFATVWKCFTSLDGRPPTPHLELTRTGADVAAHRALFGTEPVLGAAEDRVGFADRDLSRPRSAADQLARRLCEAQCRELLARRRAQVGVSGLVRDRLARASGPVPSMQMITRDLHMSVRTLRRALAAEGTSFRELDEQVRRRRAEELLGSGVSVWETARTLGYASSSSFVHAFRRWHGVSPGAFRAS